MAENTRRYKPLETRWTSDTKASQPFDGEHPTPQLERTEWVNLNGRWEYAICPKSSSLPDVFDGEILVPFSPESMLSGVERQLKPDETLWYKRSFTAPQLMENRRVLLHFGAVDQKARVFINGCEAGSHEGGYWPFTLDITKYLQSENNLLVVQVEDDTQAGVCAYGKQTLRPGGIWYTAQSGIWQTVWLEAVPKQYIKDLKITPIYDEGEVEIQVFLAEPEMNTEMHVEIWDAQQKEAESTQTGCCFRIAVPNFKSWSPEHPFLYTLTVQAGEDNVKSYFGMRKFSMIEDAQGRLRLALNNLPVFHNGLLDQGYWSDGLYTPPSEEAMVWELESIKELGFNMLRKHIKIEPMRWYYHCDRLGLLVWQDFVSGGSPYNPLVIQVLPFIGVHLQDNKYSLFGRKQDASRSSYFKEADTTMQALYNVVSLAVWVPFNEGWGQFDALEMEKSVREKDTTRLIDHASGWHDQGGGDFCSPHIYFKPYKLRHDKRAKTGKRAQVLSEFGGYSYGVEKHIATETAFGYKKFANAEQMNAAYEKLYRQEVLPAIQKGLSATVYTQLSDVEDEVNGLFTYDRELLKLDKTMLKKLNKDIQTSFEQSL